MKRISKERYLILLKATPMKVKRTRNGYYQLGKNKWIGKGKNDKKYDK